MRTIAIMAPSLAWSLLIVVATVVLAANAQETTTDARLVGTWSSKSGTVTTGPKFYDPIDDVMKEPRLPGISFSFTADGYFEEASYIVISNPAKPECPSALLQWQHGKYDLYANGTIMLNPIEVDGRQIHSEPCKYESSIYTLYNMTEKYKWYEVLTDDRRGKKRLNLYKHDGAPMNPMYLEYNPPEMLPTRTLSPLVTASASAASQAKGGQKESQKLRLKRDLYQKAEAINPDHVWWLGLGMTGLGLVAYFCI